MQELLILELGQGGVLGLAAVVEPAVLLVPDEVPDLLPAEVGLPLLQGRGQGEQRKNLTQGEESASSCQYVI